MRGLEFARYQVAAMLLLTLLLAIFDEYSRTSRFTIHTLIKTR